MGLFIQIASGDATGTRYPVENGVVFGRSGAQILLDDPKVSSKHAQVYETPDGYELRDLASKNGVIRKGKRVDSLLLVPGATFSIGKTEFEVVEVTAVMELESLPTVPQKPKGKRWHEILAQYLRKELLKVENQPLKLEPMRPAVVLDFLNGAQMETRWILGYGPRIAGADSIDLPIHERGASAKCFEIAPSEQGIVFTSLGEEVLLNGQKVDTSILRVGDRIQILDTELEVDFIE